MRDVRLLNDQMLILDGAMATELERRGFDIDDPLWSAKVLIEHPPAIKQVHKDYLEAGAECIETATYQATYQGLADRGLSERETEEIFGLAIRMACEARDEFAHSDSGPGRSQAIRDSQSPWVAASLGPYGAFLHDGSEFRGDYGLSVADLARFHEQRLAFFAASRVDLLAFETIPCLDEAKAISHLLRNFPTARAWLSFSCRDPIHLCHGEPISDCGRLLDSEPGVVAIGINCTSPPFILPLIGALRQTTAKPIVVYPNSGETWNAKNHRWEGENELERFVSLAEQWRDAGARMIGGCCRTTPDHNRSLRQRLKPPR